MNKRSLLFVLIVVPFIAAVAQYKAAPGITFFVNDHFSVDRRGDVFRIHSEKEPGESFSLLINPSQAEYLSDFIQMKTDKPANLSIYLQKKDGGILSEEELFSGEINGKDKRVNLSSLQPRLMKGDSVFLSFYINPQSGWYGNLYLSFLSGQNGNNKDEKISVYPAVAKSFILVKVPHESGCFQIYNEKGVTQPVINGFVRQRNFTVDLTLLEQGNYLFVYQLNGRNMHAKFSVKK